MNKYFIAAGIFLVWISFFDTNSLITQSRLSNTITSLEEDKALYAEKLKAALIEKENLENNKEKFAREKYLFHEPGEEIIIVKKSN